MSTENETKDIVSRQNIDWKVLKQFLGGSDKSQVNVIYVENLAIGTTKNGTDQDMIPIEQMIWHVLSRLPTPKLENLISLAEKIAIEHNDHSDIKASTYLGKNKTYITQKKYLNKKRKGK